MLDRAHILSVYLSLIYMIYLLFSPTLWRSLMDFITGFFIGAFAPFFALGWMWMAAIIAFIFFEAIFSRNEQWFFATLLLIGGGVGIFMFGGPPDGQTWLSWASAFLSILWIAGYAGFGIFWSFLYGVLIKGGKANKEFDRRKAALLERFPEGEKREQHLEHLKDWLRAKAPTKSKFIGYFFFWPFSVIGWILGDFLADFLEAVWKVLKKIATAIWKPLAGFFAAAWKRRIGNRLDD